MNKERESGDMRLDDKLQREIESAAAILLNGGVVAFPTETVYGLGADATNAQAVQKIYEIKQRPANHPLILHIGDMDRLGDWALDIPAPAWKLAKHCWPGPLTLILKKNPRVPDCVTGGQNTVGIRIPSHPVALAVLKALGPEKALAAPSANLYGKISPTTAAHVRATLNDKVDAILDGGACDVGLESTIIGFDQERVAVLRPGGIPASEIEAILGKSVKLAQKHEQTTVRVSGSLPAHYAPTTPLRLLTRVELTDTALRLAGQGVQIGVVACSNMDSLGLNDSLTRHIQHIPMPADPKQYGKQLYAVLHRCDQWALDYILIEAPPQEPAWLAILDRLQRASHAHL